jgi:hypothetical protein
MADIEQQLRAALRAAAVDAEEPVAGALIAAVRRRHRRRSRLLACLAVLAAAAVAIPAVIIVRGVVARPAPATQQHLPTGLKGLPLSAGTNLQFLTATSPMSLGQPAWYSTASETEAPVAGLPSQPGEWLYGRAQGGTWESAFCMSYRCYAPHEYYFIADGSHAATPIGTGIAEHGLVASSGSGAVWLVSYPHYWDNPATTSATARLVSTSGRALGQQYLLPAGYLLKAAVSRYLLLENFDTGAFILWNPSARRVIRHINNAIAVNHDLIAWTTGCRGCHVQILNVATGNSVSTPLPAGPQPRTSHLTTVWGLGSFSDDAQFLVYETFGGTMDIVSVKTGVLLTAIPTVGAGEESVAGWLNGGPELMVAAWPRFGPRGKPRLPAQIGFWQPGDTALRVATVKNTAEIHALNEWVFDNLRWDGYGVCTASGPDC